MAQHSSLARITFDRLICGDGVMHTLSDSVSVRAAVSSFRARFPAVPLPVPLATAFARDLLTSEDVRGCVTLLASHPHASAIATALGPMSQVSAESLLRIAAAVPIATQATWLQTHFNTLDTTAHDSVATRHAVTRHMRESPRSAGALLRALCALSDPGTAADRTAVHDALLAALRQSFVSPKDYGPVLRLLARGGDHKRVLALWSWMRHSSARWDKEAASALITSAALSRKMNVAIGAIQTLAEANEDPTLEAQRYFIRHLASRTPPQPQYAEQLVAHWHPKPKQLWTTPAREVAVELLFVHYRIKNYAQVREHLEAAGEAAQTEAERHEILRLPGMAFILRHFAVDVEHEAWLKQLCSSGMTMKDLADLPLLAGFLASLTRHNGDVESFLSVARELKMTPDNFEKMANFVADDICFKDPKETLAFITTIAEALSLEVPSDVSSWLQLLG